MSDAQQATAAHNAPRAQIVIVGCGFGGIEATKSFKGADVDVTLIDRQNHHLFQPLLYQVATAGLSAPAIAEPIRRIFRNQSNVTVIQGEVISIDVATKALRLADGQTVAFDHLIVAAGAGHSYFGNDAWSTHAPGLKTLADALDIRARMITAYERAEALPLRAGNDAAQAADDATRQACLTSIVIGAGPTGVEMAGTLVEIARHTLKREFRRIRPEQARVLLLEGGPRVLGAFEPGLSAKAQTQLTRLGVEVRLNTRVIGIDANGVTVSFDAPDAQGVLTAQTQTIPSATVVWAAGVQASPLAALLAKATGAALDRAGRVAVTADLSLVGHPHISVVGDMATVLSHTAAGTKPVPGVSPAAKQAGRWAGRNVLARLQGKATRAFRYSDYGNLATIGRKAAVVDVPVPLLGSLRFSGLGAWLFWLRIVVGTDE